MGVTKEKNGKFRARYTFMGERHNVGMFDTELKAKRAITKHKKNQQELYDFLKPMEHNPNDFIESPIDTSKPITPPKPSIMDRIKSGIEKGRTWLKDQLDR